MDDAQYAYCYLNIIEDEIEKQNAINNFWKDEIRWYVNHSLAKWTVDKEKAGEENEEGGAKLNDDEWVSNIAAHMRMEGKSEEAIEKAIQEMFDLDQL